MSISKVDQAIAVLTYHVKDRTRQVKELEQRSDLTDKQKIYVGQEYAMFRAINTLMEQYKITINANLGKLPPQATDLERSVLGAIMLHTNGIDEVKSFLLPEHFYIESHALIYEACLMLRKASKPVDMKLVVAQLRQNKTIEIIGGSYYIADLTSTVSSAANIEYHARILVEQAIKRQLILLCGRIVVDGYEPDRDCFELLDELEEGIKKIKLTHIKK